MSERDLRFRLRADFAIGSCARTVTRPAGTHEARMESYWTERAHSLGRPGYHEAPGFAVEPGRDIQVLGHEKPYGYGSGSFWRVVWLSMKAAFWSGVREAGGGTETVRQTDPRSLAVIRGVTS